MKGLVRVIAQRLAEEQAEPLVPRLLGSASGNGAPAACGVAPGSASASERGSCLRFADGDIE